MMIFPLIFAIKKPASTLDPDEELLICHAGRCLVLDLFGGEETKYRNKIVKTKNNQQLIIGQKNKKN